MKFRILAEILSLLIIWGCSKKSPTEPVSFDYSNAFKILWSSFDKYYVFFPYKKVDWKLINSDYHPRLKNVRSYDEFINLLVEMLYPLKDSHVWFLKRSGEYMATYLPDHFINWDRDVCEKYVLQNDFHQVGKSLFCC